MMRRIAPVIGFMFAGTPGATQAAEAPPAALVRAHLEISADADCVTFASVAARVAERSNRIAFVESAADIPGLRGKIRRIAGTSGSVLADLTVVQPTGRQSSRQLTAPTCEEAAEALALLVVMTLDPSVALHAQSEPQDADNATREGSAARPPSPARPASTEKPGDSDSAAPAADTISRSLPTGLSGSLGLTGGETTGPAPRAMVGLGLYGFIAFDRASVLSLALRVTAAHRWRNGIPETGGIAAFSLDVGGLDICALRLSAGPATSRLCAAGRLGRLTASGAATYDAQSHARFFASAGGAALLTIRLPAALELAAEAELGWALTRDEFAFNPQVFYRTQPLVFTLGLGIGRRFW